eukprot:294150_1
MRKFEDNFYIMKEFKLLSLAFFIGLVVYFIVEPVQYVGTSLYIYGVLISFVTVFVNSSGIFVQIWWVIHVINKDKNFNYQRENSESVKNKSETRIRDTLKIEHEFESFFSHLSKEWSMENLLFVIEISQMQLLIKEYCKDKSNNMQFKSIQESVLNNECIPKSYIVYHKSCKQLMKEYDVNVTGDIDEDDKIVEFKIKLFILFNKYVNPNSELQINISYREKDQLSNIMNDINYFINNINMNENELFMLYHGSINELMRLLT